MSEVIKDSAIKLFGRTISLPRNKEVSSTVKYGSSSERAPHEDCSDHCPPSSASSPREVNSTREHDNKEPIPSREELTSAQDDEASHQTTEELKSPTSSPSTEKETFSIKSSKIKDQIDTTTTTQDKAPKKPDKILACARCNSMDTKFCYYNNYNVNQPRHFCKNCQRYWTAGGTMRNVPVGAGRRKNKNSSSSSASYYRQMMVPETLQTPLNGSSHTAVLTFGSDNSPLCDSMASVLSLAEKTQHCVKQNSNDNTNYDDNSIGASEKRDIHNNVTSEEESVDNKTKNSCQGFTPQLCFQGSSYPWKNPMSAPNAIYQPSYHHPVSFYPTPPFWNCMPLPSWSVNNYQSAPSSGPNSPTLGKHLRNGDIIFQTNSNNKKPGSESNNIEKNSTSSVLLIPKTLRIDDPTEAAKSSIWSTLGIKNEKGNGGLFKAFASKGGGSGEKNHVVVEASPVLKANPAALSRSIIFHERT